MDTTNLKRGDRVTYELGTLRMGAEVLGLITTKDAQFPSVQVICRYRNQITGGLILTADQIIQIAQGNDLPVRQCPHCKSDIS